MRSGRSQPFATRRSSFPQSNAPALCLETHFEKLQKAIRGNAPESFLPGAYPRAHTAWRVSARTHDARRKTPNGSSFRRREVGFKNKVKDPRMPRTAYHVLH